VAGRAGRTYKRDGNGRFASTGTSGKKSRPPAKSVAKGVNKLTRDNAGKITSVGGDGATARGGRLKTAAGNLRATQTKRLKTMQGVSYGRGNAKGKATLSGKPKKRLAPGNPKSTIAKRKGLKPESPNRLKTGIALNRMRKINAKLAGKPDGAAVNIPMRGARGRKLEQSIDQAVKQVKAIQKGKMKTTDQVKKDTRQLKALRAAHEADIIGAVKKKTGRQTAEIRSYLRSQLPAQEIAFIRRWVKEKRGNPQILSQRKARADMARQAKSDANSKPRPSPKTDGRVFQLTQFRDSQRKQLREIRRQIKEAGPSAGGLRLEKLKIESRLNDLNTELIKVGATTSVRRRKP